MPLIKFHRINKGGELVINSDHIVYVEVESKSTTIHMLSGLLFSVEEPLDAVGEKIDAMEVARLKRAAAPDG